MTAAFNDVYGVLELVAAQLQSNASFEEEENRHIFNLLKTTEPNVKNQTANALDLEFFYNPFF